ncbi:ATP-binding protein [Stenotrophomonas sp. NPDC077421]|uniref:ATP-binding protein n=1 Tax=Stenotrophomonas sp. NPDC077421 TaxID=3414699 RepID=UPI003C2B9ED9
MTCWLLLLAAGCSRDATETTTAGRREVNVAVDPAQRNLLSAPDAPARHANLADGYAQLVAAHTGLRFIERPQPDFNSAVQSICDGTTDVMLLVGPLDEHPCSGLLLSTPYYRGRAVLAVRRGTTVPATLEAMTTQRISVVKGGRHEAWLRRHHPAVQRVPLPDLRATLAAVEAGAVDASMGLDATTHPIVRRDYAGSMTLELLPDTVPASLYLLMHDRNRDIKRRIEVAMAAITLEQHTGLLHHWSQATHMMPPTSTAVLHHFRWALISIVCAVLLLAAATLWLHVTQRAALRSQRRQARFIGVMSHEVRNASQALVSTIDLLGQSRLDQTQRQLVDAAHAAGAGLRSLLGHALDYSRMRSGRFQPSLGNHDAHALARQCVMSVRPLAEKKGLILTLNVTPDPLPTLKLDADSLRQLLNNLLGNALKFTHQGRIVVSLALQSPTTGMQLRLSVSDTGIGIAPDRLPRVFEAFTQAHDSDALTSGGSGLGLSICRDLARALGGEILAHSEPGQGSRFDVVLPVSLASDALEATPGPDLSLPLSMRTLLLVEDHAINRAVVAEQLAALGARVTSVGEGTAALAAFAVTPFAAVLLDCGLADLSGYHVATTMREIERRLDRAPCRIVAFSAARSSRHTTRCEDAGMDAVLCKPLHTADLLAALQLADSDNPAAACLHPQTQLLARYAASMEEDAASLAQAVETGTLPLLRYRAHRLAGVLRILGHPDLADVANDLHELDADDPALWAESARLCSYLQPRIAALADGAITSAAAGTAATAHVPETP